MLAVRDQENIVHGQQQLAAGKSLNHGAKGVQPKTPGNRFPKTPLKIPLNDENAPTGFRVKTGKGKALEIVATGKKGLSSNKSDFQTPMGPRSRAPLGAKTTNAKAKAVQTPAGPRPEIDHDKTHGKQTSARKPKKIIHADTIKLDLNGHESPLTNCDVEYCPPKSQDRPYASEDFPDNCIDYIQIKPEDLMKGMQSKYRRMLTDKLLTEKDQRSEEAYQKGIRDTDEAVATMMREDWTVGDVPETFLHLRKRKQQNQKPPFLDATRKSAASSVKGPGTVASRDAASALCAAPNSIYTPSVKLRSASKPQVFGQQMLGRQQQQPACKVPTTSTLRHSTATATSKSTIGYTKGRAVPKFLHKPDRSGLTRSASNISHDSDRTITPVSFASDQEWRNPAFLKAFEVDDEELEHGLRGFLPECLGKEEEDEEEFVMKLTLMD